MNKRIVLKSIATLLTCDEENRKLKSAYVCIESNLIKAIGEGPLPSEWQDAGSFDMSGKLVTPGLIDCHTHLVHAGLREQEFRLRSEGIDYWEIAKSGGGIMSTVRATRSASEDELFDLASLRCEEVLKNGVTAIEVKTSYGLDESAEIKIARVIARLAKEFPLTIKSTFLGLHVLPPEYKTDKSKYVKLMVDKVMPKLKDEGLISACDIFVEKNAFDEKDARYLAEKGMKLGLDFHLHIDQFSDDDGGALAGELKALSADHLDFLSAKGIRAMSKNNVTGVLLPGASMFTGLKQIPSVKEMKKGKLNLAISTDYNPGTNPTHNLVLMGTFAISLFGMTVSEAWKGITINSAKALNIQKTHGSIEIGKRADLVVFDCDNDVIPFYSYGRNLIDKLMISGDFL